MTGTLAGTAGGDNGSWSIGGVTGTRTACGGGRGGGDGSQGSVLTRGEAGGEALMSDPLLAAKICVGSGGATGMDGPRSLASWGCRAAGDVGEEDIGGDEMVDGIELIGEDTDMEKEFSGVTKNGGGGGAGPQTLFLTLGCSLG